jgi:hypothetical protein
VPIRVAAAAYFSLQRNTRARASAIPSNLCFHVLPRDQSIKSRANPASCIHQKPPRSCIDHRGTNRATRHDHRGGVVKVVSGDLQARIAFHAGHHVEQEGLQLAKACFDTIPAGDARDRSFDKNCVVSSLISSNVCSVVAFSGNEG